jgi:hypothetical protein
MRKTLLLLTTMTLALLLAAGVALAQATTETISETQQVDFTLDGNECIGEPVHFTGKLHLLIHITEDAAGGMHTAIELNFTNVKGTGAVSGGQYTAPTIGTTTLHSNSGGFPIVQTVTEKSIVIGQGQLPDERTHLVFHITINENETVTAEILKATAECRNGSQ